MSEHSLAHFFAAVAPFLEGRASHADAVQSLWGTAAPARDAERLALYARFCRIHRFEAVDAVYAATRKAIARLQPETSERIWEALVEKFFQAHPMHHVEINENGEELAPFIALHANEFALPPWMQDLAELEWWEWRTLIAPNEPRDEHPGEGPLRLASTVELRQLRYDICSWLDEGVKTAAPEAAASIVLFWRNAQMNLRRDNASPEELQLLKLIHEGQWNAKSPLAGSLSETLLDLQAAGIILGNNEGHTL